MGADRTFVAMTPAKIADAIAAGRHVVAYAAPGVWDPVASALINASRRSPAPSLSVVVDADPDICRLGYGDFDALEMLVNAGIEVRRSTGLRIGCLCVDGDGWIIAPTPILIETTRSHDDQPNAVRIGSQQVLALLRAVAPEIAVAHDPQSTETHPLAEIGDEPLSDEELEAARASLVTNPPKQFDLARKERMFNAFIEFVEVELLGLQIQRRTVKLPKDLLLRVDDDNLRDRIDAAYRVIDSTSVASGKKLQEELNELRRIYLRGTPKHGKVILRAKRKEFEGKINELWRKVAEFKENVERTLQAELNTSKGALIDSLVHVVKANPPDRLRAVVPSDHISDAVARQFLEDELTNVFPKPSKLVGEMKLECRFKGVTYETLTDRGWQKAVLEHFKYAELAELMNEYDALLPRDPAIPYKAQVQ